jgi:thioredoxin-like negative regulator of GroEL
MLSAEGLQNTRVNAVPSTDLRSWLQDALDFMIEQLGLAKSPADQFAAVDTVRGIIPFMRSRLAENQEIAANFILLLRMLIEEDHWKQAWEDLAKEPSDVFAKSVDELIEKLSTLRNILDSLPQSK